MSSCYRYRKNKLLLLWCNFRGIEKLTCEDCYPEIDYLCYKHRPKNQCIGCLRTDQKLIITGIGIICRDCARKARDDIRLTKGLCHSCLDSDVEITDYKGALLCKNCIFKREEKKNGN